MNEKAIDIRAAVCRKFGAPLTIETLALSKPAAREVRVRLRASSICHSDIIYMDGLWGGTPPIVFGHEGAGVVEEAGSESGFEPGARVVVTLLRACGSCRFCLSGAHSLCEGTFDPNTRLRDADGKPVAVGLKTGAFAEQVTVDASQVAEIGDDMPFDEACLISCGVLTGWGAVVNAAKVPTGASVAVVGCGGVGINSLQAAALSGATPLVAVDLSDEKLKMSRQFGATHSVSAAASDAVGQARAITADRGFDYVFMVAASSKAIEMAAQLVGKMGTLVLVGMPAENDFASLDALKIAEQQHNIMGTKMGCCRLHEDIPKIRSLHSENRFKLRELIAEKWSLDGINDAIAAARKGDTLRHVIMLEDK